MTDKETEKRTGKIPESQGMPKRQEGQPENAEEIAYQNKDITSKVLAEAFKGKTFRVYGLNLPEVRAVLPTNLPVVKANELRLDNLFELMDGTVAIVDYESEYKKEDKVKYLNYLTGIANRYQRDKADCPVLRMIVIYTGDIARKQVSEEYNIGAVKMKLEAAFLSELDSEGIFRHLKEKVERKELLDDEDLMRFIIQPLSYRESDEKEAQISKSVKLAAMIHDREQQIFVLSGILAFADKLIDMETADRIRKEIGMTKIGRLYEEEKRQAVALVEEEKRQALEQVEEEKRQALEQVEEEKRQALEQVEEEKQQEKRNIVIGMIRKNYPTEEIHSLVTSFSVEEIENMRKKYGVRRNYTFP